jgi:glutamine synthetase
MASNRFKALEDSQERTPKYPVAPSAKISDYYGMNVFNISAMRAHLTDEAFKSVSAAIESGASIDRQIADQVATAMKDWSMAKGATHYTHWFQPLTGSTAEKHDAFFTPIEGGRAIEQFEGNLLVQQEPDASSFPNGGIRNTFEARGYTAWDPTSPAFILGKTLCIPTIFISYTGEALDYKMPLLKALDVIEDAATEVCQYFDKDITKVKCTLGWEQEYFLVDSALFNARPDIQMTGRALIGNMSAKSQQLDDHYFGSIPERAVAYMQEFEMEALKLGIPVKTRHNEVAPNQFECAPIFEEASLAVDHNLLLMDLMEKVARKHDFRVLLHEKPFAGVNGSGKHNNWSLSTNTGVNLLSPGKNPKTNLRFLTFFVNTIKAIAEHADILRASIAGASNDHRLGGNEAPPAIVSVFIGSQLSDMLDKLEESIIAGKMTPEAKTELKLSIGKIPQILLDNTDRNRTSPFAFTGNKFEFRAVGSTANCSSAMIAINSIVAQQLQKFKIDVDARIKSGDKKDEALLKELQKLIKESKKIRFEGNGYGEEWVKEAKKRGLSNFKDTPRALAVMKTKSYIQLFEDLNIFSEREIEARHEVEVENYILKIQIESRVLGDICKTNIIPVALDYQSKLIINLQGLQAVLGGKSKKVGTTQLTLIEEIGERVDVIYKLVAEMIEARKKANLISDSEKKAIAYCDTVKTYFDEIRVQTDKLEQIIDDQLWPFPKLKELLFTR